MENERDNSLAKPKKENLGLKITLGVLGVCALGLIISIAVMNMSSMGGSERSEFSVCGWRPEVDEELEGDPFEEDVAFAHQYAMKINETLSSNAKYTIGDAEADFICELERNEYDGGTIRLAIEYAEFLDHYDGQSDGADFLESYFGQYIESETSNEDRAGYYVDLATSLYTYMEDTNTNYADKVKNAAMRAEELVPTWQSAMMIHLAEAYLGNCQAMIIIIT